MGRKTKQLPSRNAIAVIVDGNDEKWYLEVTKDHYSCKCRGLCNLKIKPDLPQKKSINELFKIAQLKIKDELFNKAILIIDFDSLLHSAKERSDFETWYNRYLSIIHDKKISNGFKASYGWMKNLLIIINNPCLEYWYLLHFKETTKFYNDFDSLESDLKKNDSLSDYSKDENYYKRCPNDIFVKLGGDEGLSKARKHSKPFDITTCTSVGCSEMSFLFDYFDTL